MENVTESDPEFRIKREYFDSGREFYNIYRKIKVERGLIFKKINYEYYVDEQFIPTLDKAIEILKLKVKASKHKDGEWINTDELMLEQL